MWKILYKKYNKKPKNFYARKTTAKVRLDIGFYGKLRKDKRVKFLALILYQKGREREKKQQHSKGANCRQNMRPAWFHYCPALGHVLCARADLLAAAQP